MNSWELPKAIELDGKEYEIRSDYRAILDILIYFQDPNYENDEKIEIALRIFYEDFDEIPVKLYQEAYIAMKDFIDMGIKDDGYVRPRTMDWEQDSPYIISGINKVIGKEVRAVEYMHWWTFLSAYMEIGEGSFSNIVSIRAKKAKGKKLEKWEQEFYRENKSRIDLNTKYSDEEKAEQERLKALFD